MNTRFAVNHFADLTNEEFRKFYLGFKDNSNRPKNYVYEKVENVAESIDWVQKGAVTPVKD
jgi:cathepsin L